MTNHCSKMFKDEAAATEIRYNCVGLVQHVLRNGLSIHRDDMSNALLVLSLVDVEDVTKGLECSIIGGYSDAHDEGDYLSLIGQVEDNIRESIEGDGDALLFDPDSVLAVVALLRPESQDMPFQVGGSLVETHEVIGCGANIVFADYSEAMIVFERGTLDFVLASADASLGLLNEVITEPTSNESRSNRLAPCVMQAITSLPFPTDCEFLSSQRGVFSLEDRMLPYA